MKYFFLLISIFCLITFKAHAARTTINTRELTQEEPPNEPPYNQEPQSDLAPEEAPLQEEPRTKSYENTQNFIPKWKLKKRALPSEDRLKELNRDKGLFKITKKKEFLYDTTKSPQSSAMGLRVGQMTLSNLVNPQVPSISYSDIYNTTTALGFFVDYEWQFLRTLGKLGLKGGAGFSTSKGNGQFEQDLGSGLVAREQYNFYLLPLNISLVYRLDYLKNQILVPYVDGGVDYYVFAETRDDGKKFNYGASSAFHLSGGAAFLLDWLSPSNLVSLDKDYGVNHLFLTAEYRIVQKMTGRFDFTDRVISAGFLVEY